MKVNWLSRTVIYTIIILGALAFMFPFIYMLLTTFVKSAYTLPKPKEIFTVIPNLTNYDIVWNRENFARAFMNSVIVASVAMVGGLFLGALTAYGFSRFEFPGKEFIFRGFLLTMMIPVVIAIVPQYIVIKSLGLVDTYTGLWLIYIGGGVVGSTFFLRGFFESIPRELEESVLIDGGGDWRIFWNIYLPQSLPAIGTLAIFSFNGTWDEFFLALTLIKDEAKRTLPVALQMFYDKHATNYGWAFAASIIALFPVIAIYITFQKKFVQGGFNEGGVKG
ncbi:carbohydrate ABC transporter permease [Marinicrinis sediminis]|uniref:Carbohydrate ABC transporter permease n=1 Tax=Marinicrinis sediminis TaxID=1652465 RepID=A0ABW5R8E2_9BACL